MSYCTCWVSKQPEDVRFGLRRGAHAVGCLEYRPSLDPVDKMEDANTRRIGEGHKSR